MSEQVRRAALSIRLSVDPGLGDQVTIERAIRFENPISRRQQIEQLETLIAEAFVDVRRFYGLSDEPPATRPERGER